MGKKRKRRKLKKKKLFIAIVILAVLILFVVFLIGKGINLTKSIVIPEKTYYLANTDSSVMLYTYDSENDKLKESDVLPRGTKIKSKKQDFKTFSENKYYLIKYQDKSYYLEEKYFVSDKKKIVEETSRFVRTSVTVYKNETDSKIASFIKKGNELKILGYDSVAADGNVNMYQISLNDITGWVYGKYLVSTKELADAVYNENGTYDIHKDRHYSRELYGGSAATLDYYPYKKEEFEGNSLMKDAKTMYINAGMIGAIDTYLDIAVNNSVNAIVVDIKDGALAYPAEIAKEYSPTAYSSYINELDVYKATIDKIKDAGIYVIGRIVVFNDSHYAADHPEDCISSSSWPSAYSRGAWEYNVGLAKESIKTFGFNEIQFDYVRFPENAYNLSTSGADFKNVYGEEKAEAVQNFLFYAADQIHKEKAYFSVDVFGECSSEYVTAYGQYWPAISNVVDVISSMPYTDHFGRSIDTWTNAYNTVYNWALGAATRQTEIPTPAIPRTWITAYDTPYWNPTITYGAAKIMDQAQALRDAGLMGGFITWNGRSSIDKYQQIKSAFAKNY